MSDLAFGEIPDDIGLILSPIVKIVVLIVMIVITVAMFRKYQQKKSTMTRNLTIMFVLFLLAPLFSSFDILLGWQTLFGNGENTFVGMSCAFICNGIGNIIYYRFTLNVYYDTVYSETKRRTLLLIIGLGEILATVLALTFRIILSDVAFLFTVIHMLLTLYIYSLSAYKSIQSAKRIQEEQYVKRFQNITRASFFVLAMIILFAIDSFFLHVTVYSLIGWSTLIGAIYFIYKGYI